MVIIHMVVKTMHRKMYKKGLFFLMVTFAFLGFSSSIFAINYGQGTYGSSVYSTASVGGATTSGSVIKGCKDPKALNYDSFVSHDQSLCKYANITSTSTSIPTLTRTLKSGTTGDDVKTLQTYLNANGYDSGTVDGIFGSKTKAMVILFQKANNLTPDGIVGPLTREYINKSQTTTVASQVTTISRTLKITITGDDVKTLQTYLNTHGYDSGTVDGIFGSKTKAMVILFQKANNLTPDGIVGPLTRSKLE